MKGAALNGLARLALPMDAERDAERALAQVKPDSQRVLVIAALDAGLPKEQAVLRLAGLWSLASAVSLMDDIADGDCHYLPPEVAPGVVLLLQSLAGMLVVDGQVSVRAIRTSSAAMLQVAAGQSLEVRAHDWSASKYKDIVDRIGGEQYAAYLHLLWDGTARVSDISTVATQIGRAGMVAKDIRSNDPRFLSIPKDEQVSVVHWALDALEGLQASGLACGAFMATYAGSVLRDRCVGRSGP